MIYLDMYGLDEYQSEKARILYKDEKPNRHNIVQFIAAMSCMVKELGEVDFGEFVYKKPQDKEDWLILYNISKKFDNFLNYYNELIVWQPSWLLSLISSSTRWNGSTCGKLPAPFTYLNDGKSCLNDLNSVGFRITFHEINARSVGFEEDEIIIKQFIEHSLLHNSNKTLTLGFYITRHWNSLQFAFALLNYLTIRVTLDKYEKESCIWRTLREHKIINNPVNSNEIKQTMIQIHKLHLSINAVNTILMFNQYRFDDIRETASRNYYNYWI